MDNAAEVSVDGASSPVPQTDERTSTAAEELLPEAASSGQHSEAAEVSTSVEPQPPARPAQATAAQPKSKPKLAAKDIVWARVKGQYAAWELKPATILFLSPPSRSRVSAFHRGTVLGGQAASNR